jgi:hypothetical protein
MKTRRGGVYVIRTRKPSAVLGLPLIGRHVGYVGLTNSFIRRKKQHLEGDRRYNVSAKDWADLAPRFYPLIPLPDWRWLLELVESLVIWALCPVYNVQKQAPWNLRKIQPSRARAQRVLRDSMGLTYRLGRSALRLLLLAGLVALALYVWSVTR